MLGAVTQGSPVLVCLNICIRLFSSWKVTNLPDTEWTAGQQYRLSRSAETPSVAILRRSGGEAWGSEPVSKSPRGVDLSNPLFCFLRSEAKAEPGFLEIVVHAKAEGI
jgi:hypothetical protein